MFWFSHLFFLWKGSQSCLQMKICVMPDVVFIETLNIYSTMRLLKYPFLIYDLIGGFIWPARHNWLRDLFCLFEVSFSNWLPWCVSAVLILWNANLEFHPKSMCDVWSKRVIMPGYFKMLFYSDQVFYFLSRSFFNHPAWHWLSAKVLFKICTFFNLKVQLVCLGILLMKFDVFPLTCMFVR